MNLDHVFAALSDGTRRRIIAQLAEGEATLSDLAEPFDMSQTAVSKHVRVLTDAGIVDVQKRGRTRFCRLIPESLQQADEWFNAYQAFWENSLQSLADHLEEK